MRVFLIILLIGLLIALGFSISHDSDKAEAESKSNTNYKYVPGHVTRNGKFVKGHYKKPVSTDLNAIKNRSKNKYYYETHKHITKERRKSKKNDK